VALLCNGSASLALLYPTGKVPVFLAGSCRDPDPQVGPCAEVVGRVPSGSESQEWASTLHLDEV